jgi:hypothetical protein
MQITKSAFKNIIKEARSLTLNDKIKLINNYTLEQALRSLYIWTTANDITFYEFMALVNKIKE